MHELADGRNPTLLNGAVYDPQSIRSMSVAFRDACRILEIPDEARVVRAVIARRIVELARCGERDPGRLPRRAVN